MKTKTLHRKFTAAFSLVEVAIAVGIAAFGLLALVGLLPQGIEMSRKTGELAAQRQILEQTYTDLEQSSWTDLTSGQGANPQINFYDDQGVKVASGNPVFSYVVSVLLDSARASNLPNDQSVAKVTDPSGGQFFEPYLMKVTVKIATSTNPAFDFSDANQARYSTYQQYIAKTRL